MITKLITKLKPRTTTSGGIRLLKALFYETTRIDKSDVVYTLKDHDHAGYPSLYLLYMTMKDPFEFRFANEALSSFEHWEMLCSCDWFKPYINRWRHELELSIRTEALIRLEQDALSGSRSSAQSNRYLLDHGWRTDKNTKGRPSKADIKREANRLAQDNQQLEDDLARVAPQWTQTISPTLPLLPLPSSLTTETKQ